jgi:chromosome segregation ATPase
MSAADSHDVDMLRHDLSLRASRAEDKTAELEREIRTLRVQLASLDATVSTLARQVREHKINGSHS